MLSFEQLAPALHKWARHFENNNFEYWELINAVWEVGYVQKLKNIQYASARVKYDMIGYMRNRRTQRRESLGQACPKNTLLSKVISTDSDGKALQLQDLLKAKQGYCEVESRDLFVTLIKDLSRDEKLIIHLRYEHDFSLADIARVIGISEARVSQIHSNLLLRLQRRLVDMGMVPRECSRVSHTPKPKLSSVYNRTYYQKNKVKDTEAEEAKASGRLSSSRLFADNRGMAKKNGENANGRPMKYKPECPIQAKKLCLLGATDDDCPDSGKFSFLGTRRITQTKGGF